MYKVSIDIIILKEHFVNDIQNVFKLHFHNKKTMPDGIV